MGTTGGQAPSEVRRRWRSVATLQRAATAHQRAALGHEVAYLVHSEAVACAVPAGLERPLQAALPLMRAADQVLDFYLRLDQAELAYRTADCGQS